MARLRHLATAATAPQQSGNGLLQTPPRNSLATVNSATAATMLQQPCNRAQQRRNSPIFTPCNSATSPYRGGETVAPLYPTRAPAAALCGAFASRCSSQPLLSITGQHQPMPASSDPARTGEGEGGGIELIVGSCVLRAKIRRLSMPRQIPSPSAGGRVEYQSGCAQAPRASQLAPAYVRTPGADARTMILFSHLARSTRVLRSVLHHHQALTRLSEKPAREPAREGAAARWWHSLRCESGIEGGWGKTPTVAVYRPTDPISRRLSPKMFGPAFQNPAAISVKVLAADE
jgi:hypothetical protein